jgi:hypothetical protein
MGYEMWYCYRAALREGIPEGGMREGILAPAGAAPRAVREGNPEEEGARKDSRTSEGGGARRDSRTSETTEGGARSAIRDPQSAIVDAYRAGYATSRDGLTWERRDAEAGIDVSDDGWDSEMIAYPHVFEHAGRTYMLYNGNGYGKTGIGLALRES